MQTTNSGNTAALRYGNIDYYGDDFKIEEEQSKDSEISHTTEIGGYILFSIDTN